MDYIDTFLDIDDYKNHLHKTIEKCKAVNHHTFFKFKDCLYIKKVKYRKYFDIYGRIKICCERCGTDKEVKLETWLSRKNILCPICDNKEKYKLKLLEKSNFKYRDFLSDKYFYLGKGRISKGIQYVWIMCKSCGGIIEVNGGDYIENKLFTSCYCFNPYPIKEEIKDIFTISQGYIKYSDDFIGTVIGTDKLVGKSQIDYMVQVECQYCGKTRNVDEEEFFNERTLNYSLCPCCRPKHKEINVGDRVGHLTIVNKTNEDILCACDCGKGHRKIKISRLQGHIFKYCSNSCKLNRYNSKFTDRKFIGQRFNSFTVLAIMQRETFYNTKLKGTVFWLCKCEDCGEIHIYSANEIYNGYKVRCCNVGKYLRDYSIGSVVNGIKINDIYSVPYKGTLWQCVCPYCGDYFVRDANAIVTQRCNSCGCVTRSIGEAIISSYLFELSEKGLFKYYREKSFVGLTGCREGLLRFDFYIFTEDKELFIEFDGDHHKELIMHKGLSIEECEEKLKEVQENDRRKELYCKNNGFPLLRIPYTLKREIIEKQVFDFLKMEGVI